ncbi:MAG: hypothetical protein KIT43_04600 [Bauldia sp.]|nr:hypothetical protein [Bauldia sp.]MCW5717962.1 hypothetical protein [Bauldia sp.]
MTARNATSPGEWQQQPEGNWDDGGYYADDQPAVAARQGALGRIWTGRPMIYILAAGLIGVTTLVLVTRPDATPAPPVETTAPIPAAPPLITYDAGPVIDNEFNKP